MGERSLPPPPTAWCADCGAVVWTTAAPPVYCFECGLRRTLDGAPLNPAKPLPHEQQHESREG